MEIDRRQKLISDYIDRRISETDREELLAWYRDFSYREGEYPDSEYAVGERMLTRLLVDINQEKKALKERKLRAWLWSAASVLVLGVLIGLLYVPRIASDRSVLVDNKEQAAPVKAGSNQAVLSLENGEAYSLDSNQQQLAVQDMKYGDGTVVAGGEVVSAQMATLETPNGGQYQLKLSDGTKVWLNAASSLKFPTTFSKGTREVELTGEGYFEVAHDASRPFHVRVRKMDLQVLGTTFNINSYTDEKEIMTTLLQGKVKVMTGEEVHYLNPGQQAVMDSEGQELKHIGKVDVENVTAWKNGYFSFRNADIQEVLRQIARWYDMEVVYEGPIPKRRFAGEFNRYADIQEVLKVLRESGIPAQLEGRKLRITAR